MAQWTYKILTVKFYKSQYVSESDTKIQFLKEDGTVVIHAFQQRTLYESYEYHVDAHPDYQELATANQEFFLPDVLNHLGKQGWEVIGFDVKRSHYDEVTHTIYLKKPSEQRTD